MSNVTLAEGNETLAFGHYKIPHSSPKTIVPITLDNPTLFLDEKKFVVSDDEMKQSDNEEKFELKPTVWFDFPSHFRGKIKQQNVVRVNFFFHTTRFNWRLKLNWCLLEPIQIMNSLSRVMTIFPTIRVKAFLNIYLLNLLLLRTFEDFNHRNQIEKVSLSRFRYLLLSLSSLLYLSTLLCPSISLSLSFVSLFSLLFLSLSSSIFAPIFLFRYLRSTIYLSSSLSLSTFAPIDIS